MIEIKYWWIAVAILTLCLGLLIGWQIGVNDGATQAGRVFCYEQNKDFIRLADNFSVTCSTYSLHTGADWGALS